VDRSGALLTGGGAFCARYYKPDGGEIRPDVALRGVILGS